MIPHVIERGLCIVVALRVRRPQIRREEAQDIPEYHLVVVNLVLPLGNHKVSHVLMRPRVDSDLLISLVRAVIKVCPSVADIF